MIAFESDKPVQVRIVDALGRVVEARQGVPSNSSLPIGHHYRPGIYIVEVMQEDRKVTLKLVKGTD